MPMQRYYILASSLLYGALSSSAGAQGGAPSASPPPTGQSAARPPRQLESRGLLPFRPQVGIGLRVCGLWSENVLQSYGRGGLGLDLLLRVHPRLSLELGVQYQYSTTYQGYYSLYDRADVPILLGLRVHPGPLGWSVSPYLVAAVGADYAQLRLPTAGQSTWFFEGQGGAGLEGRFMRHAALSVDLRASGRARSSSTYDLYRTDAQGSLLPYLGNQIGLLASFGFAVYL